MILNSIEIYIVFIYVLLIVQFFLLHYLYTHLSLLPWLCGHFVQQKLPRRIKVSPIEIFPLQMTLFVYPRSFIKIQELNNQ
jgi:hypothetical protein